MSRVHQLKIGVSGIRGVVGEFLTPNLACAFAQAFGTYVGAGRVVLGRDTRSSGEMLEHAVTCGLLSAGCEVVKVGVATTPTIQVYVAETRARGGIALTASHNPPEYNALKLFNRDGLFFNQYERSELLDLYHESNFRRATNAEMRGVHVELDAAPAKHLARVLKHVDVDRIRRRRFRVALDGVNGAGSRMSVEFLRDVLNCDLHAISVDPTKPFPREAEPRPEVLDDLRALIKSCGADIAFAQDPDGDRLAVGDETGFILDNDEVLALAVDCALHRKTGPVVVNLTTSAVIDDVAKRYNCPVYRSPVGEANVVERMRSAGAVIGGEGSNGGIIFPAVHYCRDSYMGMAFLLDRMAETGSTLSQLAATLPAYSRKMGKFTFSHGRLGPIMQQLETIFPGSVADRTDGLKLMVPGGWVHVRASNTEPILRLAAEAQTVERLEEIYRQAEQVIEGE
jgi:phosphomannomutase